MTYSDRTAIRKAEHKRRIRAIDAQHNAIKAYANNPTIPAADARRVPTYIAA
jgi:hypothetical protein